MDGWITENLLTVVEYLVALLRPRERGKIFV